MHPLMPRLEIEQGFLGNDSREPCAFGRSANGQGVQSNSPTKRSRRLEPGASEASRQQWMRALPTARLRFVCQGAIVLGNKLPE